MLGNPDLPSNKNCLINTCIHAEHINPDFMDTALRAVIYNQPQFRTDVKVGEDGDTYFAPATDFSDVFEFIDQSSDSEGPRGYAGCWDLAEKVANTPFVYGSERPLYKSYLVKRPDCYILLSNGHHVICDGTSASIVLNEAFYQYDRLVAGKGVDMNPLPVNPCNEELVSHIKDSTLVEQIIDERLEHMKARKILLPLDREELAASQRGACWINRTVHALGTREGLSRTAALCKEQGVTVGSYGLAVLLHAVAAVHIRRTGGTFPEGGIPTFYPTTLANLRTRLPGEHDGSIMLCIGEIEMEEMIQQETCLLETAKSINQQVKTALHQDRLLLLSSNPDRLFLERSKVQPGTLNEFVLSNNPTNLSTKYPWGKVASIHFLGSDWSPVLSNQTLLCVNCNGAIGYTSVCCDGENNVRDAQEVFDLFVSVMENATRVSQDTKVMDLVTLSKST